MQYYDFCAVFMYMALYEFENGVVILWYNRYIIRFRVGVVYNMVNGDNIFKRIETVKDKLTTKQRRLAQYISANYKMVAFYNSTELARAANVSGSTVIRFAEELGYSGFPQMQSALHSIVQMEINTLEVFSNNALPDVYAKKESFFQSGIYDFHKVEREFSRESFDKAVDLLLKQQNVYVVGFQGSSFLADYMAYSLSKIRKNVYDINQWSNAVFSTTSSQMMEKDVALIYVFPRFPVMTLKLAKYFHANHVPIICITSKSENSISKLADITIHMDVEYKNYIEHLCPVLYVSEVLVEEISHKSREQSIQQLECFEQYVKQNHIFCRMEDENSD